MLPPTAVQSMSNERLYCSNVGRFVFNQNKQKKVVEPFMSDLYISGQGIHSGYLILALLGFQFLD